MFKKILIANRGEIAVRIARACRELGIATVAVFSDADQGALHVRRADEAHNIGPAPASESYLRIEKVLEIARLTGADAIHPGYGFLSENARFARACEEAGIKFIGPSAASMEMMGSKTRARQSMEAAGVPFVPGTSKGLESYEQAEQVASRLGYPIMLKAAAGGGGKGMRLVHNREQLRAALEGAKSEAQRAFGDDEVYVEKAIVNPRHIEMQILADEHGNTVYLGERECSIQRRHQKVLEESPSTVVDAEMRKRMGGTAVRVARAAKYANAGTIEFLVDQEKNFYFLEMNTRLQVEHPVTESVTGLDLVNLQIHIANGEKLPFSQADVKMQGHAIECRVYAEDPENQYFPSPGTITGLAEPGGPGVRVDSGVYEGWKVPIDYDPLLAKLICYGPDRAVAIARMQRALREYYVAGIKVNLDLFKTILKDEDFQAGKLDTGYLERLAHKPETPAEPNADVADAVVIAAGIFAMLDAKGAMGNNTAKSSPDTPSSTRWKRLAKAEALR